MHGTRYSTLAIEVDSPTPLSYIHTKLGDTIGEQRQQATAETPPPAAVHCPDPQRYLAQHPYILPALEQALSGAIETNSAKPLSYIYARLGATLADPAITGERGAFEDTARAAEGLPPPKKAASPPRPAGTVFTSGPPRPRAG